MELDGWSLLVSLAGLGASFGFGLGLWGCFWWVFLLTWLAVFAATIHAQAASTFFLEQTETQFSVNLANDSSDVFIYFTSPAYSWVGVGFGEGMKNSLMVVLYPNKNGDSTFTSADRDVRMLTGSRRHCKPTDRRRQLRTQLCA